LKGGVTNILRPRVIVYSLLLVGIIVGLAVLLENRSDVDVSIVRPPGAPFAVLPGDVVSNRFSVRIINHADHPHDFRLETKGAAEAQLVVDRNPVTVNSGEQARLDIAINIPRGATSTGHVPLTLDVYLGSNLVAEKTMTFLAPVGQ